MKYRKLGNTGIEVSEIGFGGWGISGAWGDQNLKDSISALNKALDLGVNIIDTAAGYGNGESERIIGTFLKEWVNTRPIYVSTKIPPKPGIWPPSPYCSIEERYPDSYIRDNLEERLNNLKTDCIDILFLHTWTRAWNNNPSPIEELQKLKQEGKIRYIGISTPEHDQNSLIDLMKKNIIDVVQVVYNIFEQEPEAELLPVAKKNGIGIIARVPFDESALTGKLTESTKFQESDFRHNYFIGDRLSRVVKQVEIIKEDISDSKYTMPQIALKFALNNPAVSVTIPGMRNIYQAEMNCSISELPDLSKDTIDKLQKHMWRRAFWYDGK